MLRVENVATPFTAATVVVPESVPPPGLLAIATATFPANAMAVLPCPSSAVTWTAGVNTAPDVALDGCAVNTSCAAAPAVMLKAALGLPVRPLALAASV